MPPHNIYSPLEEKINVYSHTLGAFLSLIAFILLMIKGFSQLNYINIFSYGIFSISLIFLYLSSANYHNSKNQKQRYRLKIIDHCAIYILIAGSYTPYALITLIDSVGILLFSIAWIFAIIGIVLKLFFAGRFKIISTLMYVAMGWLIVFFAQPLMKSISSDGLYWLVVGGLFYTTGAVFYSIKRIPLNHAIFHIFVLAGSFCHFLSIYWYVA